MKNPKLEAHNFFIIHLLESKINFCLSDSKTLIASQTALEGDDSIEHKSISRQVALAVLY